MTIVEISSLSLSCKSILSTSSFKSVKERGFSEDFDSMSAFNLLKKILVLPLRFISCSKSLITVEKLEIFS